MKSLDRMLLSDLLSTWRQGLAISLLLACGIATFVMSNSAMRSLERSREHYYNNYGFAHVFAGLTRAPRQLVGRLEAVPGVSQVQVRIVHDVIVDIPGMVEPASCRLVSIEDDPSQGLNRLHLRLGRFPIRTGRNEVVVSEAFAEAHTLRPGAKLSVNMDGRQETLNVVGIGLSPEYVYAVQPGLMLTDNRRFGVLWMPRRQMEAAFNMEGAFNSVAIRTQSRVSLEEVFSQVDRLLKPFGGHGAYGRRDQESDRRLTDEMHQMGSMAYVTPMIFLAVAAFLFNIVLTRIVNQQKEQIASLRAFGYTRFELAAHYFKFLLVLVGLGAIVGCLAGWRMSWWMIDTYAMFFRFPVVHREFATREAAIAVAIGTGAAILGGFSALRRVVQLQPAQAMRPDPPRTFGGSLFDRIGLGWSASPIARMIVRRLEANPLATFLSILGISMGLAIMVLGSFMEDTIAFVLDVQFGRAQRQDVMLTFNEPCSTSSIHDAMHLPGVIRTEPFRSVAVRLRNGPRQYRLGLMGLVESPSLFRILDQRQEPLAFPKKRGLTITTKLAEILQVKAGDEIVVDVLETNQPPRTINVASIYSNYSDPAAYLNRTDLHAMMAESERVSGVFLSVDARELDTLYAKVKQTPAVASVLDIKAARGNFRRLIQENTRVIRIVNAMFGIAIAFGVIYNAALITLAESGRDLATMRVMGFSRREVFVILFGELAAITLLAIPIGLVVGYGFAFLATRALDTESHRFPLVVANRTFAYATVVILAAAIVSIYLVRRMLNRLDLLAVLKVKVS